MVLASKIIFHIPSMGLRSLLTWCVLVSDMGEETRAQEIQVLVFLNLGNGPSSNFGKIRTNLIIFNIRFLQLDVLDLNIHLGF